MHITDEKKELRTLMLSKRAGLSSSEKKEASLSICESLEQIILDRKAKVVHTYLPMADEVDVFPLIEKMLSLHITVICPKSLKKRTMENRVLTRLNELEDGIYGTRHPSNEEEYTGPVDLFIVPGLAFDSEGYRLGYGAGYYDTFFACHQSSFTIGIGYRFQLIDKVPVEEHDVKLSLIVTA